MSQHASHQSSQDALRTIDCKSRTKCTTRRASAGREYANEACSMPLPVFDPAKFDSSCFDLSRGDGTQIASSSAGGLWPMPRAGQDMEMRDDVSPPYHKRSHLTPSNELLAMRLPCKKHCHRQEQDWESGDSDMSSASTGRRSIDPPLRWGTELHHPKHWNRLWKRSSN